MSKAKFDPSKFSTRFGTLYYDGQKASQYRIKQYNKYVKGAGGRIANISLQEPVLQQGRGIFNRGRNH